MQKWLDAIASIDMLEAYSHKICTKSLLQTTNTFKYFKTKHCHYKYIFVWCTMILFKLLLQNALKCKTTQVKEQGIQKRIKQLTKSIWMNEAIVSSTVMFSHLPVTLWASQPGGKWDILLFRPDVHISETAKCTALPRLADRIISSN